MTHNIRGVVVAGAGGGAGGGLGGGREGGIGDGAVVGGERGARGEHGRRGAGDGRERIEVGNAAAEERVAGPGWGSGSTRVG